MRSSLKILIVIALLLTSFLSLLANNSQLANVEIKPDFAIIQGMETNVQLLALDSLGNKVQINCFSTVYVNNEKIDLYFIDGIAEFTYVFHEAKSIRVDCGTITATKDINPIPLWFSIIPPLIAILFALMVREVFSALFIGLFSGTLIIYLYSGIGVFKSIFSALFTIVDTYVITALSDHDHISIIVFSMLIGGTVHVITKNGGMRGVIIFLSKFAKSPRSGQLVTWALGLLVFFDDYANTLVVGNTMRPVTDKLKISREKLAYIVDSTAAPVASIAFVTTWIGAELSYIQTTLTDLGLDESAYNVFFSSLKYSFYPILTLIFVLLLIVSKKDFGAMYRAEKRAREKGVNIASQEKKIEHNLHDFETQKLLPARAFNALIPVGTIVIGTIIGLIYTGWDQNVWNNESIGLVTKISEIVGASDSYRALIWASLSGLLISIVLTLGQKLMSLKDTAEGMVTGFKSMLTAILILTLAWALAELVSDLHTADFITMAISSTNIGPEFLPFITFLVSGLIAFSTGSSWGTMAIMYPLILPATWMLGNEAGLPHDQTMQLFAHVVSTVIAGSVFGDHCSPISDTTILSSLASSCNHIQHVRTQLPYASIVALVALVFGTLPIAYGVPIWVILPITVLILWGIIKVFGKKTDVPIKIS